MKNRFLARPEVCIGLIALTTLVAYIPAYRAGFIWDDDRYVTRNSTLQTAEGLKRMWLETDATPQYYPLAFTTFWIENQIWGFSPIGYHVVNVLLHIGCAVLLWRLLILLALPGALFAALLFALHPLHVESVAWITERKNVLSGLFYLAAMLAYFRWANPAEPPSTARRSWSFYILAIALFLCALLSKSVTATLPAAILLILWWKHGRLTLRDILPTLPLFAVGIAMALITITIERRHVGTEKLDWNLGAIDRILIAGRAACFYLGKLFWPVNLTFIYPRWQIDHTQALQYLYPAAVVAALGALFALRHRFGRGPIAAALFYLGTLAPALGFVMVYPMRFSFVADHFCYLASIGPIVLVSALLAGSLRRAPALSEQLAPDPTPTSPLLLPLGAVLLCVLAALTWQQSRIYYDRETLWRDTLAKNPTAWVAHNNLGNILLADNRFAEAADHFASAARLFPEFPEAHNNLGNALVSLGRHDEADAELQEALRLVPYYMHARFNLGRLREQQSRPDDAAAEYRTALSLNPFFAPAYLNLVQLMIKQGKSAEALAELDRGLQSLGDKPDGALLHKAKAALLLSNGKMDEAIASLKSAVSLAPWDPDLRLRLANALFQAGKLNDAAIAYTETLAINPESVRAHYNLGVIRVSQGIPQEGHDHFAEAVRLKPDYVEARFNLGQLHEAARKFDEAAKEYREVLRLDPNHADAKLRLEALSHRSTTMPVATRPSP